MGWSGANWAGVCAWPGASGGKGARERARGENGAGPRGLLGQERREKLGPRGKKGWA